MTQIKELRYQLPTNHALVCHLSSSKNPRPAPFKQDESHMKKDTYLCTINLSTRNIYFSAKYVSEDVGYGGEVGFWVPLRSLEEEERAEGTERVKETRGR